MRQRLDQFLVARGDVASRSRAQDLISRGLVTVDGQPARPSAKVDGTETIAVDAQAAAYVSRGAEKLVAALDAFAFAVDGRVAVDLGASTGGFTQVLLARGAAHVYAVDVGRGQLHADIAQDHRVTPLEETDARQISGASITQPFDAITADVSFISLTKAVGPALALAAGGAWFIGLIKPQFEVGPRDIGKGGIVRDPAARDAAVAHVAAWVSAQPGWRRIGLIASPITGGDGNQEFLVGARKDV